MFGLDPVSQSIGSVQKWSSAHQAAESVRPACIRQERAQHRPAEEFSACSDLGRDRVLAQPAVVLPGTVRVVESPFESQRDMFGEKYFRSRAKRYPLVPVMLRVTVFGPLVDKDWHDGKPVVRLIDHLFRDQELS